MPQQTTNSGLSIMQGMSIKKLYISTTQLLKTDTKKTTMY